MAEVEPTNTGSRSGGRQTNAMRSLRSTLLDSRDIFQSLFRLLDHSITTLQAKSLLSLFFSIKLRTSILVYCCERKILSVIERILSRMENSYDAYLQQCFYTLFEAILARVPIICRQISVDLSKVTTRGYGTNADTKPLRSSLSLFPAVEALMTSELFREKIVNYEMVEKLCFFLTATSQVNFPGRDEFRDGILGVIQILASHTDTLVVVQEAVVEQLIPTLCQILLSSNIPDGSDRLSIKTVYMKTTSDLVHALLHQFSPSQVFYFIFYFEQYYELIN